MKSFKPKLIHVDPEAVDSPLPGLIGTPGKDLNAGRKDTLRLTVNKGPAIRPCPGTKEYICCGYQILHVGTGCPMDCSYCILQAYLNTEELRLFTNWDHIAGTIENASHIKPHELVRLGTGEFTDSLYLDHVTGFTRFVVPYIQRTRNMVLEFKTKTANVENLLHLDNTDRIIVSFSLNSMPMVKKEERRTASLAARLEAARRCQEKGFILGFHFDPIIHHPNWMEEYGRTVDLLFSAVDPAHIIWISLGCLRFMPQLKNVIKERFPESDIIYDEFITGLDGKMRYFKPIRVDIYRAVEKRIRYHAPGVFTYMCMESHEVWQKAFGRSPETSQGLRRWLDQRTMDFFPSLQIA